MGVETNTLKIFLVKVNEEDEQNLGCDYTRSVVVTATDITDAHALAIAIEVTEERGLRYSKKYQERLNWAWASASITLLGTAAPELQRGVIYRDLVQCCGCE